MEAKTFEVRDSGTFMPVLAIKLMPSCEADRYLLARTGYGRSPSDQGRYVMVMKLDGGVDKASSDPYEWGRGFRTMYEAHVFIIDNFDRLESGEVIDVEFILGESKEKKKSERLDDYGI